MPLQLSPESGPRRSRAPSSGPKTGPSRTESSFQDRPPRGHQEHADSAGFVAAVRRYGLLLAVGWTLLIALAFYAQHQLFRRHTTELAEQVARAYFNKDLAIRHWATSHGGVYVPSDERTPPNPYLSHIPERDITTPGGQRLTLMNPAYMMRQVQEDFASAYGIPGHITSLTPLRLENAPDSWERRALLAFEHGAEEFRERTTIDGVPHLRLMRPLVTEKGCLKCHAQQGYREDDVRGGVGVALPLTAFLAQERENSTSAGISLSVVWLLGLAGIGLGGRGLRRLAKSRARATQTLQNVVDALPDSVLMIDRDYRIVLANRTARDMTGTATLARDCRCYELSHDRRLPCLGHTHPCPLPTIIATRKPVTVVHKHVNGNGSETPVEIVATPLFDDQGEVTHIIEACRDISERVRLEEERAQLRERMQYAQKLESLGVLAGGIAHDFNNLLAAILGNTELAAGCLPPDAAVQGYLREIDEASERAADLCWKMLAYSGRSIFTIEVVNLEELIEKMRSDMSSSLPSATRLRFQLSPRTPLIHGDPEQLRQFVSILVHNAAEALPDGRGTVTVRTGSVDLDGTTLQDDVLGQNLTAGLYTSVEVADDGCGMDEETRSKLFDPFFTTKEMGRGLGLSAVLGIVRGHHGTITLHSRPGEGSTFQILLPAAPKERRRLADAADWRGSGTILLIDDDRPIRIVAREMLRLLGFTVLSAADGREALDLFAQHRDEVVGVVLDVIMPGMKGNEILRRLRQERAELPALILSACEPDEIERRFAGLAYSGVLRKPFRFAVFQEKLRDALAGDLRPPSPPAPPPPRR